MSDPSAIDRAVGQIFEEAHLGTSVALQPIAQALNGSYALLFRTGRRRSVEDASCCGVDVSYLARLKEAARERLLPGWLHELPSGSVQDRAMFGTDHEFARTDFFNYVIRPEGRFHCLIGTPFASRDTRFHLIVGRPRTHDEFNDGDQRLLRILLPQLHDILRLRAQLVDVQAFARGAIDLLGGRTTPLLVVRCDGVLLFANQAAHHWLCTGRALHIDPTRRVLATSNVVTTRHLLRAVSTAALSDEMQTVTLHCAAGSPVQLTIRRLSSDTADTCLSRDRQTQLLVRVDGPVHLNSEESAQTVARQHGLTRRETVLLSHILGGATLKDASRQIGVSYNTGRSHLRHIFSKVDVHRQSDLMRLCATGRRPDQ